MSRSPHRVALAPAYILHHRPFRDTSRILEVLTREHGRMSLFARGVRGPKARLAALLQPFEPLLLSWSGRSEAPQLTGAERGGEGPRLPPAALLAGFYLNELLLKLTTRHDPHPPLYDAYERALGALRRSAPLERTLRLFEKHLLLELGYGLELGVEARTGRQIDPAAHYQYRPELGLVAVEADAPGAIAGASVLSLADETLAGAREIEDARTLLRVALEACLEGRELATRAVARSLARRTASTGGRA